MDLISIKRFFIYHCPDKSECTMNPLGSTIDMWPPVIPYEVQRIGTE